MIRIGTVNTVVIAARRMRGGLKFGCVNDNIISRLVRRYEGLGKATYHPVEASAADAPPRHANLALVSFFELLFAGCKADAVLSTRAASARPLIALPE